MENKETEIDLFELIKEVWVKRKKVLKWGLIGVVIGLVIAFSLPKKYTVASLVVPENVSPSKMGDLGGLAALAGMSMDEELDGVSYRLYPEIITLKPFIMDLANVKVNYDGQEITFIEYSIDGQKRAWWEYIVSMPMDLIEKIAMLFSDEETEKDETIIDLGNLTKKQTRFLALIIKNLKAEYDMDTGILSISLTTQDPIISKLLSDTILVNLQSYMTKYKTGKSRADCEMTMNVFKDAQKNFYKLDSTYTAIVDANLNLTKASASAKVQRAADERLIAYTSYQQLAQKLESIKQKIQEQTPVITTLSSPTIPLKATSPNKIVILIAFTFLLAFSKCIVIVVRYIININSKKV